ncbi:TPA: hypothetical protein JAN54_02310 [Legionella pneumophila]|nr:hypothetical protein [Legionella pneumophila]
MNLIFAFIYGAICIIAGALISMGFCYRKKNKTQELNYVKDKLKLKTLFETPKRELTIKAYEQDTQKIISFIEDSIIPLVVSKEEEITDNITKNNEVFFKRNSQRWKEGFIKLEMLREISYQAGVDFQQQFIKYPDYVTDPLLGVLMRQHANACRIIGEIIVLLKNGYPDGAIARWRTLFEILINCMVIDKYGKDAAEDYIKHGVVKSVEGMQEYQKTAKDMNLEPFETNELEEALTLKENLTDGEEHFHWARKYTKCSKMEKLREHVGMERWSHNYKLASKFIHADYYDLKTLFAMAEAKNDLLLAGASNSGLVEPASMAAVTFSHITAIFITTYIKDKKSSLDFSDNLIYLGLLNSYTNDIGEAFIKCQNDS